MNLDNVKAEAVRWRDAAVRNYQEGHDKQAQYCFGTSDALANLVEEECGDVLLSSGRWLTAEEYIAWAREDGTDG